MISNKNIEELKAECKNLRAEFFSYGARRCYASKSMVFKQLKLITDCIKYREKWGVDVGESIYHEDVYAGTIKVNITGIDELGKSIMATDPTGKGQIILNVDGILKEEYVL